MACNNIKYPEEEALDGQEAQGASDTSLPGRSDDAVVPCSVPKIVRCESPSEASEGSETSLHLIRYPDEEYQILWSTPAPAPAPTPIKSGKPKQQRPAAVIAKAKAPPLPSSIEYHSDLIEMRVRRKRRTIMYGVATGVAGLLILGPLGVVFGVAAAVGTDQVSRHNEQKKLEELQPAIDLKAESTRLKRLDVTETDAEAPKHAT